jgi:hypothetical protein
VAPLTLPGLSKVCYDLRVRNSAAGAGETVWARGNPGVDGAADTDSVCSTQFGDGGGGAITFVGSCDASPVNVGDPGRTNSVTLWVDSLYGPGGVVIAETGSDGWQDPCSNGCTLDALCEENVDTKIEFNLTILRQANQGFFDIGVNFEDIFCSAKVDCKSDPVTPIKLLFNPATGQRDTTVVAAFACTAGAGAGVSTMLYRDGLKVTCGSTVTSLDPDVGRGNAWGGATVDPAPSDAIWQYAIYADDETLTCGGQPCNKRYWNVAIGIDPTADNCALTTSMTASAGGLADFTTPTATTYPYISVNVPLTDTAGLICSKHPLNGGTGVSTVYTLVAAPEIFDFDFDGKDFHKRVPVCTPACQNGGTCTSEGCDCPSGFTGSACETAVPTYVTSGLVLDLDAGDISSYAGTGTTWSDRTAFAHHATLLNGVNYSSAYDGGLVLNGTSQNATVANAAPLNPTNAVTYEAWFTSDALASAEHGDGVIAKGYASNNNAGSYEMLVVSSGGKNYPFCRVFNGAERTLAPTTQPLELGARYHVACTYDGSFLRMYVNGVEVGSGLAVTPPLEVNSQPLWLGSRFNVVSAKDSYFTGTLHVARVYGRGLTANEIRQNFDFDKARFYRTEAPGYTGTNLKVDLDAGRVASYPGAGTTWTDLSGHGRHGVLTNGPRYHWPDHGAISFDGVDDNVTTGGLSLGNTYSFEMWFNPSAINMSTLLSSPHYYAEGYAGNFILRLSNASTLDFATYNGRANEEWSSLTIAAVPTNRWSHLVIANDAGAMKIYMNGVQVGTRTYTKSLTDAVHGLIIGDDISWTNSAFNGKIALFRVYDRALSASEVTASHLGTKQRFELMLSYDFARKFTFFPFSTSKVVDLTGRGNGGMTQNGASRSAEGGGSLLLDGNDDHATFGTSLGNGYSTLTVTAWIKPSQLIDGYYTTQGIVVADDGSSAGTEGVFSLHLQNFNYTTYAPSAFVGRHLIFGVRTASQTDRFRPIGIADNFSIWPSYLPGLAIAKNPVGLVAGEWHHVAGVYTGTESRVYLNGVLVGSSNAQPDGVNRSVTGALNSTSMTRTIGALAGSSGSNFPGYVRAVRVYQAALTTAEILAEYQALDPVLNP